MKIAILQTDIEWCNASANIKRANEAIAQAGAADLYVLPEMFTTGFITNPTEEIDSAPTIAWMQETAARTNAGIAGSLAICEGGKFYNRFYFVEPNGKITHSDKRHLFSYGGEDKSYTPGDGRVVVAFRGVRILLLVCYDIRFPVWSRNHIDENGQANYDAIIYVANWPTSRVEVWDTLLRARAIENQCYVVGVNRVGNDPLCPYNGSSQIVDPYGRVAASCGRDLTATASLELNLEKLQSFRQKFPVLRDAD